MSLPFIPRVVSFGVHQATKTTHFITRTAKNCRCFTMCSEEDIIYVAFQDKPAYFTSASSKRPHSDGGPGEAANIIGNRSSLSKHLGSKVLCMFLLDTPTRNEKECGIMKNYINSGILAKQIARSNSSVTIESALCLQFSKNLFYAGKRGHIKRGVFFYSHEMDGELAVESVHELAKLHGLDTFSKLIYSPKGNIFRRHIIDTRSNGVLEEMELVHSQTATENESRCSPIFRVPSFAPVQHEFSESLSVLKQCDDVPEVEELLGIVHNSIVKDPKILAEKTHYYDHPFVVVEGMDGTGKTTITQLLTEKLGAKRFYTPPPQIQHLRKYFDGLPEIVRRAYYCVGNYIVAIEIAATLDEKAVVMDRFWHSTAAYGIANESSSGDMPECDHAIYRWPDDLLKPSVVLFLTVSEEVRRQRMTKRGEDSTFEELQLERDQLFRQRLCESYRRMREPSCVEIDVAAPVEGVLELAVDQLRAHGIDISSLQD